MNRRCNADLWSAVTRASGLRAQGEFDAAKAWRLAGRSRPADRRSALQQTGGLRYGMV